MAERKSLKEVYPQKYSLKLICRLLYYSGFGDYWYEPMDRSALEKRLYPIWVVISNGFLAFGIFNEFMAYTRADLTEKEMNDLMQHTFAHSSVYSKFVIIYLQRKRIRAVLKRFVEETRSIYSSSEIDKAATNKSFRFCFAMGFILFVTLTSAEIDGVRAHFQEDIPIRGEVIYYPSKNQTGILVNLMRFSAEFHWYYLVAIMTVADSLAICSMIYIEAKFKLLQLYFQNLGNTLKDETKNITEREEEYKKRFIDGIRLHEDALWSANSIQYALGTIYSVQIFESLSLLVVCLIKLVASELTLLRVIAILAYTTCMITLTGTYMIAAGDITHEASMLSTSIFHCGWELYLKKSEILPLAVVAIQRSQVPVYMTAFGVIELSYVNFISVLRSSYSFFAVMY
ncbi:uncharacterized protein LOC128675856 [Plodia interpunctella]|uniref:uncharacterized protein LOC128675856 n=1 Tax=Plodia interpunctella TaxID=58824 RepID=UPI00236774C3|nr:uncharacterized protein LOC128675856 [Plodia interpunctella]